MIHLAVLSGPEGRGGTVGNTGIFNHHSHTFRWGDDYSYFSPIPLSHTDEASWQANESFDRGGMEDPSIPIEPSTQPELVPFDITPQPWDGTGIPF